MEFAEYKIKKSTTLDKLSHEQKTELREKYLSNENVRKSNKLQRLTKSQKKAIGLTNPDEARATLKFARISARKVNIVANLIRGKDVNEAMAILQTTRKAASEYLIKLLNSAIANAENNKSLNRDDLYISELYANQGPTLKRIRARAQGRANRIRKRTSHITLVVKERN